MNKTLNVFGAIFASFLSIALVVLLIATPLVFSGLSLLDAKTITKVVTDTFTAQPVSQPSADSTQIVTLSNVVQTDNAVEDVGKDVLTDIFGDSISQEQMGAILSSKAAQELIETYAEDLTGALTGSKQEAQLDAEKLKSIINDNIDDLVQVLQENVPECANMDAAKLKGDILKAVDEQAEELVQKLPDAEKVKEMATESVPALGVALEILAKKDTIKMLVVGAIVLLSALIFACRIPDWKGFRWLALDMFIGGGISLLTGSCLLASKSAMGEVAELAGAQLAGAVGSLLGSFAGGVLIRALVILAFGGVMLGARILINKLKAKKLTDVAVA